MYLSPSSPYLDQHPQWDTIADQAIQSRQRCNVDPMLVWLSSYKQEAHPSYKIKKTAKLPLGSIVYELSFITK
jgi:hypothetical protein